MIFSVAGHFLASEISMKLDIYIEISLERDLYIDIYTLVRTLKH